MLNVDKVYTREAVSTISLVGTLTILEILNADKTYGNTEQFNFLQIPNHSSTMVPATQHFCSNVKINKHNL